MRIAIDARMMGAENTRGIGRYIEELVRAMVEIAPEHRYVLIVRRPPHAENWMRHPSVETIVADIPWYGIAEQLKMPGILASARADVVYFPHWNVPLFYRAHRFVVTIHDLLLRHEPASAKISTRGVVTRSLKRFGYRLTLDQAISGARKILVPTQFVAEDVAHFYPNARHKIAVTGEGMGGGESGSSNQESRGLNIPASSFQLPASRYLLYVGSAYPHKGLEDLLAAWETISAMKGGAIRESPLRLVIAGEMDVFMRRVKSLAEKKNLPRVEFLGRVADAHLAGLYAEATGFVYPTHFEGFGLPPLEAIASGCPVISSDAGPLRDVLGNDGAIFFRAGDINGIIRAVAELLRTRPERKNHAPEIARRLAGRWSWKRAAETALDAFREAASTPLHGG